MNITVLYNAPATRFGALCPLENGVLKVIRRRGYFLVYKPDASRI